MVAQFFAGGREPAPPFLAGLLASSARLTLVHIIILCPPVHLSPSHRHHLSPRPPPETERQPCANTHAPLDSGLLACCASSLALVNHSAALVVRGGTFHARPRTRTALFVDSQPQGKVDMSARRISSKTMGTMGANRMVQKARSRQEAEASKRRMMRQTTMRQLPGRNSMMTIRLQQLTPRASQSGPTRL